MDDRYERLISYLRSSDLFAWLRPVRAPVFGATPPSAEHLAKQLFDDAAFQALELGTWLRSPDGALIAQAVGAVVPPEYRIEIDLAVGALKLAARWQHEIGRKRAGALALAALAVLGLLSWKPRLAVAAASRS